MHTEDNRPGVDSDVVQAEIVRGHEALFGGIDGGDLPIRGGDCIDTFNPGNVIIQPGLNTTSNAVGRVSFLRRSTSTLDPIIALEAGATVGGGSSFWINGGSGSPEGVVFAPESSLFFDDATPALWLKTTPVGVNTGWQSIATGNIVGEDLEQTLVLGNVTGVLPIIIQQGSGVHGEDGVSANGATYVVRAGDAGGGAAGALTVRGGNVTSGTANAGALSLLGGNSVGGATGGLGGSVSITAGFSGAALTGGTVSLTAGTGGPNVGGAGGNVLVDAGAGGGGAGGVVIMRAGAGAAGQAGGTVDIDAGAGAPGGTLQLRGGVGVGAGSAGGAVTISAGAPGTNVAGSSVSIFGQNASGAFAGGNISLTPGTGTPDGAVVVNGKLTVTGLIDPIGLVFGETPGDSDVPVSANEGALYVSDGSSSRTDNALYYKDDSGTHHQIAPFPSGNTFLESFSRMQWGGVAASADASSDGFSQYGFFDTRGTVTKEFNFTGTYNLVGSSSGPLINMTASANAGAYTGFRVPDCKIQRAAKFRATFKFSFPTASGVGVDTRFFLGFVLFGTTVPNMDAADVPNEDFFGFQKTSAQSNAGRFIANVGGTSQTSGAVSITFNTTYFLEIDTDGDPTTTPFLMRLLDDSGTVLSSFSFAFDGSIINDTASLQPMVFISTQAAFQKTIYFYNLTTIEDFANLSQALSLTPPLSTVLSVGRTTGGNDIETTHGDIIVGEQDGNAGDGGDVAFTSGATTSASNNSGNMTISSGVVPAGGTGNTGGVAIGTNGLGAASTGSTGNVVVVSGNNTGTGNTGFLSLRTGNSTGGTAGLVQILAGNGVQGGNLDINSGDSSGAATDAGVITVQGGDASDGKGGNVQILAGNATGGVLKAGGSILLTPGSGFGGGANGVVQVNGKLTVTGPIDPTALGMSAVVTNPLSPVAPGNGALYVNTSDELIYENSGGTINLSTGIGGTQDLASVLGFGSATGGSDITVTAGDPLILFGNVSVPGGAPAFGSGKLWVQNTSPTTLVFTDDANQPTVLGTGSALTVQDETIDVDTDTVIINFTGVGVTASGGAPGTVNVSIPGGAGGEDLATTLALGRTTGGNLIEITNGDGIVGQQNGAGPGGTVPITGGASTGGGGSGGPVQIVGGSADGAGIGGQITLSGGTGGATSGQGGNISLNAGTGGLPGGQGGAVVINAGFGRGAFQGGFTIVEGGDGNPGDALGGAGGNITVASGTPADNSGGTGGNAGDVRVIGRDGGDSTGAGGDGGIGGDVTITSGDGGDGNGAGDGGDAGNIILNPGSGGAGASPGVDGQVTVNGALEVTGKLTVGGAIDPTGMVFDQQASAAAAGVTPTASQGSLWVKNTIPTTIIFTDSTGTDHTLNPGAGGDGFLANLSAPIPLPPGPVESPDLPLSIEQYDVGGKYDAVITYSWTPAAGLVTIIGCVAFAPPAFAPGEGAQARIYKNGITLLAEGTFASSTLGDCATTAVATDNASGTDFYTLRVFHNAVGGQTVSLVPGSTYFGGLTSGAGGGVQDLATTLGIGNTTGITDIEVTAGTVIHGDETGPAGDLVLRGGELGGSDGGDAILRGGAESGGQVGGDAIVEGGAGAGGVGSAGGVQVRGGSAPGGSGNVLIEGGQPSAANQGGEVRIAGGSAPLATSDPGGDVYIQGGDTQALGTGGDVVIFGGDSDAGILGDVDIRGGRPRSSSGIGGNVYLRGGFSTGTATITITGAPLPSPGDTVTIDGILLTAVVGTPGLNQFAIAGSTSAQATNLATAISLYIRTAGATASGAAVNCYARAPGVHASGISLSTSAPASFSLPQQFSGVGDEGGDAIVQGGDAEANKLGGDVYIFAGTSEGGAGSVGLVRAVGGRPRTDAIPGGDVEVLGGKSSATGTIAVTAAAGVFGDTVTIDGVLLTSVAASAGALQFVLDATSNIITAQNLARAINEFVPTVKANQFSGTVNLWGIAFAARAQNIPLATSNAVAYALSGASLAGIGDAGDALVAGGDAEALGTGGKATVRGGLTEGGTAGNVEIYGGSTSLTGSVPLAVMGDVIIKGGTGAVGSDTAGGDVTIDGGKGIGSGGTAIGGDLYLRGGASDADPAGDVIIQGGDPVGVAAPGDVIIRGGLDVGGASGLIAFNGPIDPSGGGITGPVSPGMQFGAFIVPGPGPLVPVPFVGGGFSVAPSTVLFTVESAVPVPDQHIVFGSITPAGFSVGTSGVYAAGDVIHWTAYL